MAFKRIAVTCLALCLMATLAVAMSGCEDLGAYEDTEEYYGSFGDVVLINGTSEEREAYSVEDYFYNKSSREDFLAGEDGAYKGIAHSDYVYVAIPFESSIEMDTIALYLQSQNDVTVYINVFLTDKIPANWRAIADNVILGEENDGTSDEGSDEKEPYDDPDPEARLGEITVHLKSGKWNSFVLDTFYINGATQKSIEIKEGQYILLQIRNNSGVRVFDETKQAYVDPQTGLELQKAEITMTNLLIRALDVVNVNEVQGGEHNV